jgi:hypothetical protein
MNTFILFSFKPNKSIENKDDNQQRKKLLHFSHNNVASQGIQGVTNTSGQGIIEATKNLGSTSNTSAISIIKAISATGNHNIICHLIMVHCLLVWLI